MTSTIPVQWSTHFSIKPTGSWSFSEFYICLLSLFHSEGEEDDKGEYKNKYIYNLVGKQLPARKEMGITLQDSDENKVITMIINIILDQ